MEARTTNPCLHLTHTVDENNNVVKQYELENDVETNVIEFVYDSNGSPIYFTYNNATYYYEKNLQGDIVAILDANGNTVVEYTYDIWGKLASITGTLADTIGAINPLRYRGYYYDTETELYYLQSRYYSPDLMRFISQDDPGFSNAQGEPLGSNLYVYCLNNPVVNSDPNGEIPVRILYAIAGAALFGGVTYLIGRIIGISGKTLAVLTASLSGVGALAAALLGPKFLAKVAPKLAKWFQKVAKGTQILPKNYNRKGMKLSEGGIVILDAFKIMFHPPHIGKHNYFHIQIEVKIPGVKMNWKVLARIPINPTKWF